MYMYAVRMIEQRKRPKEHQKVTKKEKKKKRNEITWCCGIQK